MKWANHKLVTTVVVFAGTGNFLYAAYSFFGSVLPDRLEGKPPKESKLIGNGVQNIAKIHIGQCLI